MYRRMARYVPRGSVVLAVTTLGSYALGFFRDIIFAWKFGLSLPLDSYNAAFFIPDLLFNVLVASGMPIERACEAVLDDVTELGDAGGCIAVDRAGNVAAPFTTEAMAWGVART